MLNVSNGGATVCCSNVVTTGRVDWQYQCWNLAEGRLVFELQDLQTRHFMFCFELCAEYDYHFTYSYGSGQSIARFTPLKSFQS